MTSAKPIAGVIGSAGSCPMPETIVTPSAEPAGTR